MRYFLIMAVAFVIFFGLTYNHIENTDELSPTPATEITPIETATPIFATIIPIKSDIVQYQEPVNPCYFGPELGIIHTMLDDEYRCVRCHEYVGPRYGFTDDEVYLLAQLLCGDASVDGDGEFDFVYYVQNTPNQVPYDQIALVLTVVMNRVRSEEFPNTVKGVVMQKGQFAVMPHNADTKPHILAIEEVQKWCEAYDRYDMGVENVPENHLYFHSKRVDTFPYYTNVSRVNYR